MSLILTGPLTPSAACPCLQPGPAIPFSRAMRLAFDRLHGAQLDVAAEHAAVSTLCAPHSWAAVAVHAQEVPLVFKSELVPHTVEGWATAAALTGQN